MKYYFQKYVSDFLTLVLETAQLFFGHYVFHHYLTNQFYANLFAS
jgi:hypothetical protein